MTTDTHTAPSPRGAQDAQGVLRGLTLVASLGVLSGVLLLVTSYEGLPGGVRDTLRDLGRGGMALTLVAAFLGGVVAARRGLLRRLMAGELFDREEPDQPLKHLSIEPGPLESAGSLARVNTARRRIEALGSARTIDAIALVRELMETGFSVGASDVHLTPTAQSLHLALRIDGVLHEVGELPARHRSYVINRVKVLAKLSLHVTMRPQDGRFAFQSDAFQARVSTLPTNHGEKVVIRLAVQQAERYRLEEIGFDAETLLRFRQLLGREHGLIYLTGPTGSGKTTTMYAALLHLKGERGTKANLVTLEDPMEMDFPGIAQTEVNPDVGLTFATGLRSILRQDPDVILVGEIRDEETAATATRAANTGHLLLTSVHADSSVGVFQRLEQLHVDMHQAASASIAVVNQRLAIRNCERCRVPAKPDVVQERQLALAGVGGDEFFVGAGCSHCNGTGRRGRVPLIEVLAVTDGFRELLVSGASKPDLERAAMAEGMIPLQDQAVAKAKSGELPLDELVRILDEV
ncbi:MAG: GspE/PulE family protein [Myxococcota bacterium]